MNRPECLCPGYTQVETFGPDDEYDEEEEVVYVTLDLVDVDASLIPSSKAYRLMVSTSIVIRILDLTLPRVWIRQTRFCSCPALS